MPAIPKYLMLTLGLIVAMAKTAFPQADTQLRLLEKIRRSSDTSLINAYMSYGYWWESSSMDSAAFYYQQAGRLATKTGDVKGQLRYYANYTYVLNQEGKPDKSLPLNLEALELARRSGSQEDVANCLFNIGSSYNNLGNYDKALYYYLLAADVMEKMKSADGLITVYDNIAGVFTNSGQYEKAYKYNIKAYNAARKLGDSLSLAKTLINKGNTEYLLNRSSEAQLSVTEGMVVSQRIRNPYLQSIALNTLANIYNRKHLFNDGIRYSLKALGIARVIESRYSEVEALKTITGSYAGLKNNDSCIAYALQALQSGTAFHFKSDQYILYDELAAAYAGKHDFEKAFNALAVSRQIHDSLNKIEVERKMQMLESNYIVAQNERQIISLEKEKKQQQLFIITLIGAIAVGLLLSLLIYRNIKTKKKTAEQIARVKENEILQLQKEQQLLAANYILKGQEDERSRLAKDLHDGLGGLLSGIKLSLVNAGEGPLSHDHGALQQLDNAMLEMRRIAHSMMPEALVRFGLTDALNDFCNSFSSNKQCKIHFQVFGIEQRLHQNMEIGIYRIVQELVNNAIRHSKASDIYIQLVHDNATLHVTVEDNGCGFVQGSVEKIKGIGLRNVSSRVDYLDGTLDIQTEEGLGTTITIIFNIKA